MIAPIPLDKLALFGAGYLADFLAAQIAQERRDRNFRQYVADGLYVLCRGGLRSRWEETAPGDEPPEPDKTPDQIRAAILAEMEDDE